ncbi:MAG TPA: NAD(P)-dependent oxidoreductase [Thermoanaerobaculia bacterium]|nr:NAD(P)-dependent oxidoreductase [Thermoanaerobaculia bacterium]HQR66754.1 NAD(P)-dependent oxidoreductase [Thermoanaerobaculia bacterium]
MTVVLTGATGFIGGHVARELARRGVPVTALHRRPSEPAGIPGVAWQSFDEWERRGEPSAALVHVAAVRHRHGVPPDEYGRQNVALTERLLEGARGRTGRFVDVSSIAVFGWPKELPIDETRPFAPVGPYGRSKVATEQMVRTSGLPYAIVRPSITYGPRDTNGMIDKLFRLVKAGRYRVVGSGESRVQLVYAEDLAFAIAETALRPGLDGAEFICTYREPISILRLSSLVGEIAGRPVPSLHVPLPVAVAAGVAFETLERMGLRFPGGEPPVTREKLQTVTVDRAYRIDRMRSLLGWEPPTSYEEGLRRTAAAVAGAPA